MTRQAQGALVRRGLALTWFIVVWNVAHARQRPALRAIAVTFYALAAFVAFEAVRDLVT